MNDGRSHETSRDQGALDEEFDKLPVSNEPLTPEARAILEEAAADVASQPPPPVSIDVLRRIQESKRVTKRAEGAIAEESKRSEERDAVLERVEEQVNRRYREHVKRSLRVVKNHE